MGRCGEDGEGKKKRWRRGNLVWGRGRKGAGRVRERKIGKQRMKEE